MKTGQLLAGLAAAFTIGAPLSAYAQQRAGLPPADEPLIRRFPQPSYSVEGGAGIVGFTGGVGGLGAGWNVRVNGALSERFSLEANYTGSINQRADTRNNLVMTAIDVGGRYNLAPADALPLQPFVTAGVGYAGFAGRYGDGATLIVPVGVGADRMLTPNIKVGGRFTYRPAFFDNLASPITPLGDQPGADTWSLLANLGGGF